jgi:uncharacterized protein (UPF0128 family)
MKIYVKESTKVWINGKEYSVNKGEHDLEQNIARILLEAGYADLIEKKEEEEKKKGR